MRKGIREMYRGEFFFGVDDEETGFSACTVSDNDEFPSNFGHFLLRTFFRGKIARVLQKGSTARADLEDKLFTIYLKFDMLVNWKHWNL